MSGKVRTTWISDDIGTCPEKKVWNSVSGKYRTSLHLVTTTWNCKQVNSPGYPRFIRARFPCMAEQGLNQWEKTLHRQHRLSSGNRPCAGIHAFWICMFHAWMCVPRSRLNCIPGLARSLGPVPNSGPRVPENGVARWRQQNWQIYSAYPVIYQYSPPVQLT